MDSWLHAVVRRSKQRLNLGCRWIWACQSYGVVAIARIWLRKGAEVVIWADGASYAWKRKCRLWWLVCDKGDLKQIKMKRERRRWRELKWLGKRRKSIRNEKFCVRSGRKKLSWCFVYICLEIELCAEMGGDGWLMNWNFVYNFYYLFVCFVVDQVEWWKWRCKGINTSCRC